MAQNVSTLLDSRFDITLLVCSECPRIRHSSVRA